MNKRARLAIVGLPAIIIVGIIGYFSGIAISDLRSTYHEREKDASLQRYMEKNLKGIEVGKPLPQIPIWSADGKTGYLLDELLPKGGVITYVAGTCESCKMAVSGMSEAQKKLKLIPGWGIVLVAGDPSELLDYMKENSIDFQVYRDVEQTLGTVYRLKTFPTAILLDSSGVIRTITTGTDSGEEFVQLLQTNPPM